MSAGSNNIVIQIVDQIDPAIAGKIKAIGTNSRQTVNDLNNLKAAMNGVATAQASLNTALAKVTPAAGGAATGTNRFTSAIAQLISRVAGAELGMGMLGGAFGRVGTAAGLAGPLIVAALAVAAIAGAILIYQKFEEAARKLVETQTQLAAQFHSLNDTILEQHETLIGLTQGPMAKYQAELRDLPFKSISVDIANINKLLDDQKSHWADLVAAAERYSIVGHNALVSITGIGQKEQTQNPFSIQQAKDYVAQSELIRTTSTNQKEALEKDLADTGQKLTDLHNLEATLTDRNLANTEVSRQAVQQYYNLLTQYYQVYLGKKAIAEAGAAGDTLAIQRKLAAQQLREFNDELSTLKNAAGVVSPQQILALRQAQLAGDKRPGVDPKSLAAKPALPLNQDTIKREVANAKEDIDRQNQSLALLVERYKDAGDAAGAYSDALKIQGDVERASTQIEKIKHDGDPATLAAITAQIIATVESARVNQSLVSVYDQFQGPLLQYHASLDAINTLQARDAISAQQASSARQQATRQYQDAINPLNEYNIGLEHEISLLGVYGRDLTVATEIDRIRQQLQKEGYDLTNAQATSLSNLLTFLNEQKQIQTEINQLNQANAGLIQDLIDKQIALNTAKDKGIITETQFKVATAQVNIQLADQANLTGKNATLTTQLIGGIGKYIQNYQGLAKGLSDAYGQAFTTIADGAANSLGRAIAYGEDLGKALQDVARQALSELISGFIKLGIQWVLNELIAKGIATASLAATTALATATATAWAPAAALSAIATFGASAAAADIAIAQTVGVADALALAKFAGGGYFQGSGTGRSDSNIARIGNGEYIVNADATARNRGTLDTINNGGSVGNQTNLKVQVIHDGSTNIQVQQTDEGTVRVIAKQEAQKAVHTHAPSIIASEIQNPNSQVSKSVQQNLNAPRKR